MRSILIISALALCGCAAVPSGSGVACEPIEIRAWSGPFIGPVGAAPASMPAFDTWVGATVDLDGSVDSVVVVLAGAEWGCSRPTELDVAVWSGPWEAPQTHARTIQLPEPDTRAADAFEEVRLPLVGVVAEGVAHVAVRLASGTTCVASTSGLSARWEEGAWEVSPHGVAVGVESCEPEPTE